SFRCTDLSPPYSPAIGKRSALRPVQRGRAAAKVGINRANKVALPMPGWKAVPPKDDHGYLDLMSRAIFSAGLNWRMVEKKWPHFRTAFRDFSPEKVARLSER